MKTTVAEFIRHLSRKTQQTQQTQKTQQTQEGTVTVTKHDCFVTVDRKKYLILFSRNRELADSLKNGDKALFEIHGEDPSPSRYPLGIMVFTSGNPKPCRVTSQFEYARLVGGYDGVAYVSAVSAKK